MSSIAVRKPQHSVSLLLLEQNGAGNDPLVWEIEYEGGMLPGDPRRSPEKLHEWLAAKKIGTAEPRRSTERELLRKIEELARSNRELEQFACIASHDLREPLRMISTYTQLLAERYRGKLDQNADQYLDYAAGGALRMQALIQDLLALSRVGGERTARQAVDCNLIVEQAIENLNAAIQESSAVVYYEDLPAVPADPTYLLQVFQNLIANGLKFRRAEPSAVSVLAERSGAFWQFSVTDNGIGISPEQQGNLFTIFGRLHPRAEYPGNGIGLAICKKIVERYGGRIWVESVLGYGSSFKFTLPAGGRIAGELEN